MVMSTASIGCTFYMYTALFDHDSLSSENTWVKCMFLISSICSTSGLKLCVKTLRITSH